MGQILKNASSYRYLPHLRLLHRLQVGGLEWATSEGPKVSEQSEVLIPSLGIPPLLYQSPDSGDGD